MFIDVVDLYQFILLSVALTLFMGLKVNREQNLLALVSCMFHNWSVSWFGADTVQVELPDAAVEWDLSK